MKQYLLLENSNTYNGKMSERPSDDQILVNARKFRIFIYHELNLSTKLKEEEMFHVRVKENRNEICSIRVMKIKITKLLNKICYEIM